MKYFSLIFLFFFSVFFGLTVVIAQETTASEDIRCGADKIEEYLPILNGKRIGLVVNHTGISPDTLINRNVDVRCIFAPEHGYKGVAGAGEHLANGKDEDTGLKIFSLYGKDRKPRREWLEDIDLVIFDMQDVGARFYTYLSTLKNVIEACMENGKMVMVLDRPNPNDTIDGPVLRKEFSSFVGCIEIPLLHGSTLGELAQMMVGEGWVFSENQRMENESAFQLIVIPCSGWRHGQVYEVPIAPSPNLPNPHAIALYPSLCLFEGTEVSVGRGTEFPFEAFGHPSFKNMPFSFTPKPSASNKNPLQNGKTCRGKDLRQICPSRGFSLEYLLEAYKQLGSALVTSPSFFDRLAGTDELRKQILDGKSEKEIRASWQNDLEAYRKIWNKYRIYPL